MLKCMILHNEKRLSALFLDERTWGCLISCTYDWPSGKEAVSILPSGRFGLAT